MKSFLEYLSESRTGTRHVREIYHGEKMPPHIYNLNVSSQAPQSESSNQHLDAIHKMTSERGKGSLYDTAEYMKPVHSHWTQYINHANGEGATPSTEGFRKFIQTKNDAVDTKTGKPKASGPQRKAFQSTLAHIDQHGEKISQYVGHHNTFRNHVNAYVDEATQHHSANNRRQGVSQHLGGHEYGVEGFTFAGASKTPHNFSEDEMSTISPDRGHYEHIHELLSKGKHGVTAVGKIVKSLAERKVGLQAKAEGKSAIHIVTRAHPVTGQTQHGIAMKGIDNTDPKIAWDTGDAKANHEHINNVFGYNQKGDHRPELVNTLHTVLQNAHHITHRTSKTPGSVQVDFLGNHNDFHQSENGDIHTTPNVIQNIWHKGTPEHAKVSEMIKKRGMALAVHSSFDSPEEGKGTENPGMSVLNTMKLIKFGSKDTGFAAYNRKFGGALSRGTKTTETLKEDSSEDLPDTFASHKPTHRDAVVTIGRFTSPHENYPMLEQHMNKIEGNKHIFASHKFEPHAQPKKGVNKNPLPPAFKHRVLRQTFPNTPVHMTNSTHSGYIGTLRRVAEKYPGRIHLVLGPGDAEAANRMIGESKNLPGHEFLNRVRVHLRSGEEGIRSTDMRKLAIAGAKGDASSMKEFEKNLAPSFREGAKKPGGITARQLASEIEKNSRPPPPKERKSAAKKKIVEMVIEKLQNPLGMKKIKY